jgi:anti-sigma regulatory factor (Ser/Thr protein kinase)
MDHTGLPEACTAGYRHEAFFYANHEQFLEGTGKFTREALAAGEPILVVLEDSKLDALRRELGREAGRVLFADMAEVGLNPARIIPAWQDFVATHGAPGRRIWGIGEPISPARSSAELVECQRHEALLNVVFSDPAFSLLCPYDTATLGPAVLEQARRNHPFLREAGVSCASADFPGVASLAAPFDDPLPPRPATAASLDFEVDDLRYVRLLVGSEAKAFGLSDQRTADLVLAVDEIATNSLLHGGGRGSVWVWRAAAAVICEVQDEGRIEDPLAGRRRPSPESIGGRGLWIANQLCELVQVRTFSSCSVVRLHMRVARS